MEIIRMSKKELWASEIIARVINGDITQRRGALELNKSLRQIKRLCKRYREEGAQGLAHRSRGKPSKNKVSASTYDTVLALIKRDYPDFGPQLIKEQLMERNHKSFSREWIRSLMIKEGIWQVKKRKNLKIHQRRARRSREGELVQIDGSPEHWFEDRNRRYCLINMVDDATSKIMECRFVEEECLEGYFSGMKRYIERHGRPVAIYSDRHTIFKSPKVEGKHNLTQFGRAMKELEIELIFANSPQAKGRVERSHSTLQDRLIKLMRLDGISTVEEGNKYLEAYRNDYNKRFGRKSRSAENAHRKLSDGCNLKRILCRKEKRKISKNMEVQYKCKTYQLKFKSTRRAEKRCVMVSEIDGKVVIEYEGKECSYTVLEDQPYREEVMDRKKLDAFLDRKKPMTVIERHRKGINTKF
jgi:hypothetical protein